MNQQVFFEQILRTLESIGIPYMVAGSVGAMLYGEPRMTNDIDIVVELRTDHVAEFVAAFDTDTVYVPPVESIHDAIRHNSSFNVIHSASGSKADFILRRQTEHGKAEFLRKVRTPFTEALTCFSATPEDIVLAKLRFYQEGGSEKHLLDIVGMLKVTAGDLDNSYLGKWVAELGLEDEWAEARSLNA